jgi:hypothetical protein
VAGDVVPERRPLQQTSRGEAPSVDLRRGLLRLQALLVALTAPEAPAFKGKSALKKQLELIDAPDRESLTRELVAVARAGGALERVAVVHQLEKYFALLGADPKSLYDMAHTSMGSGASAPPAARAAAAPGVLDTARIAALRKETAEVDNVLSMAKGNRICANPKRQKESPPTSPYRRLGGRGFRLID